MDSEKNLSSEYWNLHRNSLFLSAALFMVCLIPNVGEIKLLGLEIKEVGASALALLLMIAATYAYIVFFIEWTEEALVNYRERRDMFVANRTELKRINDRISSLVGKIEHGKTKADFVVKTLSEGSLLFRHRDLDASFMRAEEALKSQLRVDLQMRHDPQSSASTQFAVDINSYIEIYLSSFKSHMLESVNTQQKEYEQELIPALNEVKNEYIKALDQLVKPEQFLKKMGVKVSRLIKKDYLRYIIFGLFIPTSAFAVAMYHGIEKIFMIQIQSPIVNFLRSIS